MIKKTLAGGIVILGILIFGFIFLLRSCLSKYDERSSLSKTLVFENNGKVFIFSMVQFDKTISYSRNGGFIRKSISTTYYLQLNDAATGKKIKEAKLKKHSSIKSYPVEVIGALNGIAVLYAGELMLVNPITLEIIANTAILEAKLPHLKGKFPKERQYYALDNLSKKINITATDGIPYAIDPNTLQAGIIDDQSKDVLENEIEAVKTAKEHIAKKIKENYDNYRMVINRNHKQQFNDGSYQKDIAAYEKVNAVLQKEKDSVQTLLYKLDAVAYENKSLKSKKTTLQSFSNSYGSTVQNSDTFLNQWYGLFKADEVLKTGINFQPSGNYDAAARNYLYSAKAVFETKSNGTSIVIDKEKSRLINETFLAGGFLLDKETGIPKHLDQPNSFIVLHKDQIGADGKIIVSRVDLNGKILWKVQTALKSFSDWIFTNNYLIIKGNNNKELSSNAVNMLYTIVLQTGVLQAYDFFKDRIVTN